MRSRLILAILAVSACILQKVQAETLTLGYSSPITSADPHFYNAGPTNTLAMHLFDRLVERGPDASLRPGLAASWNAVDDHTWEFHLRPGVTWSDGAPLTADDVAFTLGRAGRVPNSPGGFAAYLRSVQSVEVLQPLVLRIHSDIPAPTLPGDLTGIAIVSRHAGAAATTADYNSGKAAIGTGAYRMLRNMPGDIIELVRNDNWWGEAPAWDRVIIRTIPNGAARLAALLSGDVDLIDAVPPNDIERSKATPTTRLASTDALRVFALVPDFSHDADAPFVTGNDGGKIRNPLRDRRVREALSLGLNRTSLAERVMAGAAVATRQFLPPGLPSHADRLTVQPPDLDRARALLAEAGFPAGFRITLHAPNDRYPNDAVMSQAIAQMWTRIGVRTAVETMPWSSFSGRAHHGDFAISLWGLGVPTAEAGYMLVNILGTPDPATGRGAGNFGQYSNPALDELAARALQIADDAARNRLLIEATEMAINDFAIIPVTQFRSFWASRSTITYQPRMDERTVVMGARPLPK
jgi:peptide/nickel transport system substrate-binding protein